MAALFGFGNTLISDRALAGLSAKELYALTHKAGRVQSFAPTEAPTPFTPIDLGRPLSIEVMYVYTGGLSEKGFLQTKPDMLMTSAVKRLPMFESAPRAVNFISNDVPKGFEFADIAATRPGTPLVYHSPALTDRGTAVTIELF